MLFLHKTSDLTGLPEQSLYRSHHHALDRAAPAAEALLKNPHPRGNFSGCDSLRVGGCAIVLEIFLGVAGTALAL
jgi:hypothetical protein